MTDTELLPCPFCGATQHDVEVMIESSYYMVGCIACGCASINHVVRDEAIAAWNKRAIPIDDILSVIVRYTFMVERGQDAHLDRINAWLDKVRPLEEPA